MCRKGEKMRRSFKKVMAGILTVLMIFGSFTAAFAEETEVLCSEEVIAAAVAEQEAMPEEAEPTSEAAAAAAELSEEELLQTADADAPVFSEFKLWTDDASLDAVHAFKTISFSVKVTDDDGVEPGTIDVQFSNGDYHIARVLGEITYDKETKTASGSYTFCGEEKAGKYQLSLLHAADIYGKEVSVFPAKEGTSSLAAGFTFDPTGYVSPLSEVKFAEAKTTLKEGDVVHFSFKGNAEFKSVRVIADTDSSSVFFAYKKDRPEDSNIAYDSATGLYSLEYTMGCVYKDDVFEFYSIDVDTGERELTRYFTGEEFKAQVKTGEPAASVSEFSFPEAGKTLVTGDTVHFSFKADCRFAVKHINIYLKQSHVWGTNGSDKAHYSSRNKQIKMLFSEATGRYEGSYTFTEKDEDGVYDLGGSIQIVAAEEKNDGIQKCSLITGQVALGTARADTISEGPKTEEQKEKEEKKEEKQSGSTEGSGSSSSGGSSSGGSSGGGSSSGSSSGRPAAALPSYVVTNGSWAAGADGSWTYTVNGAPVVNQWMCIKTGNTAPGQKGYSWYMFGPDGKMLTGWFTDAAGNRYFLDPVAGSTQGSMATGWKVIDGAWYYFNAQEGSGTSGALLVNTTTPDGYKVGPDGKWIP